MESMGKSVQEYIKSGEYFIDARKWYKSVYVYPILQRSLVLIFCCVTLVSLISVASSIYYLLPIKSQVKYSINSRDADQNSADIIKANMVENDPLKSIALILARNYVMVREQYDYNRLKSQITFIKNSSTRLVFKKFYSFIDINNKLSPIIRYQKEIRRTIKIISATTKDNEADVVFESVAKDQSGSIFEAMKWHANVVFEIDKIDKSKKNNSTFNFTVTHYKLKLLEDNTKTKK